MRYHLLSSKRGILLSHEPEKSASCLTLEVENAPEGSEIIFNVSDRIIYRFLENGKCELSKSLVKEGPISVTLFEKDAPEEPIRLDGLYAIVTGEELVFIPNALEMEGIIAELRLKLDKTSEKVDGLTHRLEEIYDGYETL